MFVQQRNDCVTALVTTTKNTNNKIVINYIDARLIQVPPPPPIKTKG